MAVMDVKDATGATVSVGKYLPGSVADAASLPVTQSTEDKALTGALTETAPASDTASSGLNGRLQRIAQRLTSLIAQIPATLGIKTAANSMSVTHASDDAALAVLGATTGAAVITDADGTIQQYLRGLIVEELLVVAGIGGTGDAAATIGSTGSASAKLRLMTSQLETLAGTNAQFPATPSSFPITTITRPANTTAYTAGDTLGGAITIATGLTSGQNGAIIYAYLLPQIAAIPSGMTSFRLYLYDVTPVSAIADNAAFTWTSTDWAAFLGYIDLGSPVDLGSGLLCQVAVPNQPIKLNGSANIFAYLVTNGGFTPAGNSEVYTLRVGFIGI